MVPEPADGWEAACGAKAHFDPGEPQIEPREP